MRLQEAIRLFIQSGVARNLTPVTLRWYEQKLQRFARSCPEVPTSPWPIEDFLAGIEGSPETKHAHYRTLRALFNFLHQRYGLPNPMTQIAPPRCPKKVMATLEPGDLMHLLHSATNLRDKALLTLLIDTGLRSSEAAGLRRQDIGEDTIKVQGKSGQRQVPISEETRDLLLAAAGNSDYVFRAHKAPLSRKGIYRIVSAHMRKAGIQGPKLGGHRIRHGFGKNFLMRGGDTRSLQQIMGHSSISTTEKYTALNLSDTVAKHHQFTPLRAAYAAAQESLFDSLAVQEAEAILNRTKPPPTKEKQE